jgi:hypothetical protein
VGLLYQQFGVTANTAKTSKVVLQNFFGDCIVGRGIWPPQSQHLTPPELFSWTFSKNESSAITPQSSRNLNTKMSKVLPALTSKFFEDLQETIWKG